MIDIIVITHNEGELVRKCIESVRSQSDKNYTLTVVADSADDKTLEVLHSMGIEPIITDCHSAGGARNAGFEATSSEYVWWIDGDDYILHDEVVRMLNEIIWRSDNAGNPKIDMLNFGFIWKEKGYMDATSNGGNWFPNAWSRLWRREAVGKTRFDNLPYAEDVGFFSQMLSKEITYINWDVPMIYYNNPREGSLTWQYGTDSESEEK